MRTIVNAGRLTVTVPPLDLLSTGRHLWLISGSVSPDEIDHWPGAVARDEVAAIARIFDRRHDSTCDVEPFPAESLKYRRQHRHNLVPHQDVQQSIQVLEVRRHQLIEMSLCQVVKADVEPFILGAIARSS